MRKEEDRRIIVTVPLEPEDKAALQARADANDRAVGREAAVIIKAAPKKGKRGMNGIVTGRISYCAGSQVKKVDLPARAGFHSARERAMMSATAEKENAE